MGGTRRGTRLTQREAAERVGVSVEAIRKRVKRGTLRSDKGEDGRRYVYLDSAPDADRPQPESSSLISEMRDRIASLERQLEQEREANSEHRRLLAAALERIPPQLEAPAESAPGARQAPDSATEGEGGGTGRGQSDSATSPRPWWRRI